MSDHHESMHHRAFHAATQKGRQAAWNAPGNWFLTSSQPAAVEEPQDVRPPASGEAASTAKSPAVPITEDSHHPTPIPLAVRSPYLNTWQPSSSLAGTWPRFWNGRVTAICGIARIDGVPYLFAGSPGDLVPAVMSQVAYALTATRSVFVLEAAGVRLTATYFSPADPDHLRRACVPCTYVSVQAASADGADHDVSVHLDISAEWAHGDSSRAVTWQRHRTAGGNLALTFTPVEQSVLGETGDQACWGTVVFATAQEPGVTWEVGPDTVVRERSASLGWLTDTADTDLPRPISDEWPVAGLNRDFGIVTAAAPSPAFVAALGHVRTPAVSYLGTDLPPWWTRQWSTWKDMLDWFLADYPAALTTADAFDAAVTATAVSEEHGRRLAMQVRQTIGGTEIVDRNGTPWIFLKDIASEGRTSPLDVLCSTAPILLSLSPNFMRLLLEPVFDFAERGGSATPVPAPSELGLHYPHADGSRDTREDSPVERTARLLMTTASLLRKLPAADAASFAKRHDAILRAWAEYTDRSRFTVVAQDYEASDPSPERRRTPLSGWYLVSTAAQVLDRYRVGSGVTYRFQ